MIDGQSPSSIATAVTRRVLLPRFRQWLGAFLRSQDPWISSRLADQRALQLLNDNLSKQQRDQLATRGYFEVTGGTSGKRYRIRRGHQMNVELLDGRGRPAFVLCFMPKGQLAYGDIMLAQK